jgi:hypothetical protein
MLDDRSLLSDLDRLDRRSEWSEESRNGKDNEVIRRV